MKVTFLLAPNPGEVVQPGVFEAWVGETVPLRGPDRKLIGEATITKVENKQGIIHVDMETTSDGCADGYDIKSVADVMRARAGMSFSFRPQRDDAVAKWLQRKRDIPEMFSNSDYYWAIDGLLDEYRTRADYGLSLESDMSELPGGG